VYEDGANCSDGGETSELLKCKIDDDMANNMSKKNKNTHVIAKILRHSFNPIEIKCLRNRNYHING
jgi:hypothetical protein